MTQGLLRYLFGTLSFGLAMPLFLIGGLIGVISPAASRFPLALTWTLLALATLLVVAGAYLWYRAIEVTPGEDLFSDHRGLIMSLMVITALIIAAGTLYFALNPDFLRGALDGALE